MGVRADRRRGRGTGLRRRHALLAALGVTVAATGASLLAGSALGGAGATGPPAGSAAETPAALDAAVGTAREAAPGPTRRSSVTWPRDGDAADRRGRGRIPPAGAVAEAPELLGAKLSATGALADLVQDEGDAVPLPDGRTLWVFADTTEKSTAPKFFVTSSAAVTSPGSRALTYAADDRGHPVEFLPRTAAEKVGELPGARYNAIWPTGATRLPDGRIIISYAKYDVTTSPQTFTFLAAGLFEYRYDGVAAHRKGAQARRIADDLWKSPDGAVGSPVSSGGFVYFTQCEDLRCYSLRTTPAGLADRSSYRWWTGSGWSAERGDRRPMTYGGDHPGRNPSTVWVPNLGLFAATDTSAGAYSTVGLLWVSPTPYGPWSAPARFLIPACPAPGCYTLNLHPAESGPLRMRVSYATAGDGPHVRLVDVPVTVDGPGRIAVR